MRLRHALPALLILLLATPLAAQPAAPPVENVTGANPNMLVEYEMGTLSDYVAMQALDGH
jgi:hypothetical protein